MFITFEGIDGSGKSTQIKHVAKALGGHYPHREIIMTREPGGTPLAEKIRNIALHEEMDKSTEILLMMASRQEHVTKLIKPKLAEGAIVLCDRFVDSTYAYQVTCDSDARMIENLQRELLGDFTPDMTFLFSIDPVESLARTSKRGDNNKFESKDIDFYKRVDGNYKLLASRIGRIVTIDATRTIDEVTSEILTKIVESGIWYTKVKPNTRLP